MAIRTSGDRLGTASLATVGGKGLFVREIEEALLERRVDLAVHSLKDLPAVTADGLALSAFPPREDPRDVLVSRTGANLAELPDGCRVGTSSLRRRIQLLARRGDLVVETIRGNVDTRLRKLGERFYDAVVLAAAGLRRLDLHPPGAVVLSPEEMLPAVGQGTLAIQTRGDDDATRRLVAPLDHAETRAATLAERSFLEAIGGACTTPLAAYACLEGGTLWLRALVATPDGSRILREDRRMPAADARQVGEALAAGMLARGAAEIVRAGSTA